MGNDGGSIPSRHEMVRTKAIPTAKDDLKQAAKQDAWSYCALSRSQLAAPLVSDGHGKLYNKESILTYLLDPTALAGDATKQMAHVKSLKDVVELALSKSGDRYICEVTRRDMDGATPFVYLTVCGHALAQDALDHVDAHACPVCDKPFVQRDIIPINPTETKTESLRQRLQELAKEGLTHSGVPVKKKKRKADTETGSALVKDEPKPRKKVAKNSDANVSQSAVLKSLFHSSNNQEERDVGFMNRGTASRIA